MVLAERMMQSSFPWVCANVDMSGTGIPQPFEYSTISLDGLDITFLGLLETYGKAGAVIPSTHPLKVQGIHFEHPENVITEYSALKTSEDADLYIALTHLGHDGYYGSMGDFQIAHQYPYFDMIIGGHSSYLIDTLVNHIPVFQAGKNLEYLGKIELVVRDGRIEEYSSELIDLGAYTEHDPELQANIDAYYSSMEEVLNKVVGYSHRTHERHQLGCFYTDALRERLGVDITFQNHGGIRSGIDEGDITVEEIYAMDPFQNGAVIYEMSAADIKNFLEGSGAGFYYSGVSIEQSGTEIELRYPDGTLISDNTSLTVGINDYIPAVHEAFFPATLSRQPYTTAEAIIYYLENIHSQLDYIGCSRYFRYQ
jgi:2',3'-cyclic-nucleotide 2'-phosphodiesterase (5'-nucleotidase family)